MVVCETKEEVCAEKMIETGSIMRGSRMALSSDEIMTDLPVPEGLVLKKKSHLPGDVDHFLAVQEYLGDEGVPYSVYRRHHDVEIGGLFVIANNKSLRELRRLLHPRQELRLERVDEEAVDRVRMGHIHGGVDLS